MEKAKRFSPAKSIWSLPAITAGPIPRTPAVACRGTIMASFASVAPTCCRWRTPPALMLVRCAWQAHATGSHFVFCDGAVHFISYLIDPTVYTNMANRTNRAPVNVPF